MLGDECHHLVGRRRDDLTAPGAFFEVGHRCRPRHGLAGRLVNDVCEFQRQCGLQHDRANARPNMFARHPAGTLIAEQ